MSLRGLFLAVALPSLAAPPVPYVPDPAQWRLEMTPDLGGWMTASNFNLHVKIVDPKDPEPPQASRASNGWSDEEGEQGDFEEDEPAPRNRAERQAWFKMRQRAWAEKEKRNAWRKRNLIVWFNGSERVLQARVGYPLEEQFECQDGENRLELMQPDSGVRVVRTWWAIASRVRLLVKQVHRGDGMWNGNLQVVEPSGEFPRGRRKTSSGGIATWNGFTHPDPPPGTYTVRWVEIPMETMPTMVTVDAYLDPGTERERQWHFSRLIVPGSSAVTLGTIDVEN